MPQPPNILIIWGDDIGISNLSCYSDGLMGYRTPNIDRIAAEGVRFTDYYGEQSCTAGRAAFITGQNPYRTGLTKVGMPGADIGLRREDPTIATALKAQGYATGQFGKNHLGDRDEFLPTVHGFDEFFGNLYHLNAEEEPELATTRPRGLPGLPGAVRAPRRDPLLGQRRRHPAHRGHRPAHQEADGDRATRSSATRRSTSSGASTSADTPFFVWFNSTHMHFRTHVKPESRGRAGRWQSDYHDTMLDHDDLVGDLLDLLDELGIADDTIVIYSTDNGPHMNTWPDAGMTPVPQREELQLGGRLPGAGDGPLAGPHPGGHGAQRHRQPQRLVRHPARRGRRAGHRRAAPAGRRARPAPRTRCTSTATTSSTTSPARPTRARASTSSTSPTTATSPRCGTTTGSSCSSSNAPPGTLQVWAEPYTELRVPKIFNLRTDPYERADITSNTYFDWLLDHVWLLVPAQAYVADMLADPRRVPAAPEAGELQPRQGLGEAAGRGAQCVATPAGVWRSNDTGSRRRTGDRSTPALRHPVHPRRRLVQQPHPRRAPGLGPVVRRRLRRVDLRRC